MDELITTVRACRRQALKLHSLLASGKDVRDALASGPMSDLRSSLTGTIETLEEARHQARLSLVATGLDQGMSIGDFSRIWGISRQLAARYAREVRDES